jgi:hypothetical protein
MGNFKLLSQLERGVREKNGSAAGGSSPPLLVGVFCLSIAKAYLAGSNSILP